MVHPGLSEGLLGAGPAQPHHDLVVFGDQVLDRDVQVGDVRQVLASAADVGGVARFVALRTRWTYLSSGRSGGPSRHRGHAQPPRTLPLPTRSQGVNAPAQVRVVNGLTLRATRLPVDA